MTKGGTKTAGESPRDRAPAGSRRLDRDPHHGRDLGVAQLLAPALVHDEAAVLGERLQRRVQPRAEVRLLERRVRGLGCRVQRSGSVARRRLGGW
jgi:hypothetical protein